MTEARRKTKIILLQQRKTLSQLAKESGLAEATVHNILDGRTNSRKSREAITNALGAELWNDVPISQRRLILPTGTEIEFENESAAEEAEREFGNFVRREFRTVILTRVVDALIHTRLRRGNRREEMNRE